MNFVSLRTLLLTICFILSAGLVSGQDILLDQPVRAGNLTLFKSLSDTTSYYYVPDQARLATGESGLPRFSFLRYVSNTTSGTEAEGGGIVHAVVELSVPEQEVTRAEAALQRVDPAGTIVGPVVYRSGLFGLVSSFRQENGDLTRQVVGLGRAPILDGGRAAVSLRLTKLGAQILWESFQLPTPDISFTFEMEMSGYFSPVRGSVHADFDRLYTQHDFSAGVATDYLGAEIELAFDRAREDGAIEVEIVGDDAQLEKLIWMAYDKIADKMFEKQDADHAQKTLQSLSQGQGQGRGSILDRAMSLYESSQKGRTARNKEIRASNQEARESNAQLKEAEEAGQTVTEIQSESNALRDSIVVWEDKIENLKEASGRHEGQDPELAKEAEDLRERAAALQSRRDSLANAAAEGAATLDEVEDEIAQLDEDIALHRKTAKEREQMAANAQSFQTDAAAEIETLEKKIDAAMDRLDTLKKSKPSAQKTAEEEAAEAPAAEQSVQEQAANPGFAALAVYKMKRTRQTGDMDVKFSKYTTSSLTLRFDRNIGDLRSYFDNDELFRSVNLDDPLYVQREIQVSIDGLNADHFGNFVNFVSVLLKKRHQNGEVTTRELTVKRDDFNERGNNFSMVYGWNGDDNRDRWLEYQYKSVWSLFGNINVEKPWADWRASAIPVAPPYQPKTVTLEAADTEALKEANVRAVHVSLIATIEGEKKETRVTMLPSRGEFSKDVELLLPADNPQYEYQIEWVIRGSDSLRSDVQTTTNDLLFIDELPL